MSKASICSLQRDFSRIETALESLAIVTLEEEVKRGSLGLKVEVGGIIGIEEEN